MDVALTPYRAAIDALFARTTGVWKLGLERVAALLSRMGDPHRTLTVLHVGGTNGKGSVVATAEAVLRDRGLRVARYTSPHLIDFRERVLVDRQPIPESDVLAFLDRWMPDAERLGASFFEITTAMAFDYFAKQAVDVAVVEVGLGGRLDATNVVDPRAAIVTALALDHTEWLGETIPEIAKEKGGIFKANRPAVIGERDEATASLLRRIAQGRRARPISVALHRGPIADVQLSEGGTRFVLGTSAHSFTGSTPLIGRHQAENTVTALVALHAADLLAWPESGASIAIPSVVLPGRFQRSGTWIFDVAHNPAGSERLADTVRAVNPPRPVVAVLGVLRDKDWRSMMRVLSTSIDEVVVTQPPTAPDARSWSLEDASDYARSLPWRSSVASDFDDALSRATSRGATQLATGSFHTVGDAMARLQVNPLAG